MDFNSKTHRHGHTLSRFSRETEQQEEYPVLNNTWDKIVNVFMERAIKFAKKWEEASPGLKQKIEQAKKRSAELQKQHHSGQGGQTDT